MAVFTDIDFSMELNDAKDVGTIEDLNSIKTTLYNNLMIGQAERPFDNTYRMDIRDVIHEPDNFITRKQIRDAVQEAVNLDSRIKELTDVQFESDGAGTLTIKLSIAVKIQTGIENVSISLIFYVT